MLLMCFIYFTQSKNLLPSYRHAPTSFVYNGMLFQHQSTFKITFFTDKQIKVLYYETSIYLFIEFNVYILTAVNE